VVQKPEHRVDAVRLAWQPGGVRQVINEIKVTGSDGIKGWARDNWIAGRLRTAILFDKNIQSVNYTIECVQGVVYLIGIAQNQSELNKVSIHARNIPYVKQVVTYVKLAGAPVEKTQSYQPGQSMGNAPALQPDPVTAQPLSAPPAAQIGAPRAPAQGRSQPIVDQGF
jgi:hypothetical protein